MSNSRAEALTAARARKKRGPGGVERNVVLHRHAGARGRFQDGTPAAARGYTLSERFAGRDRRITPSGLKAGNGEGEPPHGGGPLPGQRATHLTRAGRK